MLCLSVTLICYVIVILMCRYIHIIVYYVNHSLRAHDYMYVSELLTYKLFITCLTMAVIERVYCCFRSFYVTLMNNGNSTSYHGGY